MAATLASSLLFGILSARNTTPSNPSQTKDKAEAEQAQKTKQTSTLLTLLLLSSSLTFLMSSSPRSEQAAFWVFVAYEAAVGMYFPTMGYLKGQLVEDKVRAQVYGLLRVPLNVFVVVSLLLTRGLGDDAYGTVFFVCSVLLMAACGSFWVVNK
jgi:hypothetical protein